MPPNRTLADHRRGGRREHKPPGPSPDSTLARPESGESLLDLARELVERARGSEAEEGDRWPRLEAREILLDVELEGVRCLLIDVRPTPAAEHISLSPREREIARMVARGYPNKTIAAVLDISSWTVSTYLRRIFAKLGVRSRAAMVARLLATGVPGEAGLGGPPDGADSAPMRPPR